MRYDIEADMDGEDWLADWAAEGIVLLEALLGKWAKFEDYK